MCRRAVVRNRTLHPEALGLMLFVYTLYLFCAAKMVCVNSKICIRLVLKVEISFSVINKT